MSTPLANYSTATNLCPRQFPSGAQCKKNLKLSLFSRPHRFRVFYVCQNFVQKYSAMQHKVL